jgi:nicotinate-nucleotide adenylyltransferase
MSRPVTIAVFGGSFNPPTIGHAMVVQWLLWSGKADRVIIVPSGGHPFGKEMLPLADRVTMLEAMCRDIHPRALTWQKLQVSAVEGELPKPVYTYDLLTHIREHSLPPHYEIRFVIGADILQETEKWHKWDKVREEFGLIIMGREGYPSPDGNPIIPGYSSTEVRRRFEAGENWQELVTPGVRHPFEEAMRVSASGEPRSGSTEDTDATHPHRRDRSPAGRAGGTEDPPVC